LDHLFLDANILFSAAYREGAGVQRLWNVEGVSLLTSTFAVEEARRNLDGAERRARLDELLRRTRIVSQAILPEALLGSTGLPDADEAILAGALAANATHLITGDVRHFGPHFGKSLLGVIVLSPRQYLDLLRR
jgi:predicted nucleic acid-binding protein